MVILLNALVLIFEILYYSLFMKFCKRQNKLKNYIFCFAIITLIGLFIKTDYFISYPILIFLILYGLKYIAKIKVTLYDMLVIFIMLLFKFIIEIPSSLIIYKLCNNIYISSAIVGLIKTCIILILNNKIGIFYNKFYKMWKNNNFYIRYIFSIMMFTYIITTFAYIVVKWI